VPTAWRGGPGSCSRIVAPALLNVAGNRESTEPGIGVRAERFLVAVFGRLAEG